MTELIFLGEKRRGSCYLLRDDMHVVIFDPGMAWHADETIADIKALTENRTIEAVILTHSHYDHLSALPCIKKEWPQVPVYAAAYVQKVLSKETARKTMMELSADAAQSNGTTLPADYDESLLSVDRTFEDGTTFDFGEIHILAVECIGHTKDSYAFVINDHMMVGSETLGMIYAGGYEPQCLVSFKSSFESLERCSKFDIDLYGMPHMGPIKDFTSKGYWDLFKKGLEESKDVILDILKNNENFEDQIRCMDRAFLDKRGAELIAAWPYDAFFLNAKAMLKTAQREYLD